jgi:hypothetical protein
MNKTPKSRIRELLKRAGSSNESLQKLIQRPEEFAKEAGLSHQDAEALRGADLVIALTKNPLAGFHNEITTSPITITVTTHHGHLMSGDPPFLDQLEKQELINVLRRALESPGYLEQLRKTLKSK